MGPGVPPAAAPRGREGRGPFPEETVRKLLSLLLLALLLAAAAPASAADQDARASLDPSQNRIAQLTGTNWLAFSQDAKMGILFGVELVVDVERAVQERIDSRPPRPEGDRPEGRHAKKGKKGEHRPYVISRFARAWYEDFHGVPLKDISDRIDAWYAANPDRGDRLVLEVIWVELMKRPIPPKR